MILSWRLCKEERGWGNSGFRVKGEKLASFSASRWRYGRRKWEGRQSATRRMFFNPSIPKPRPRVSFEEDQRFGERHSRRRRGNLLSLTIDRESSPGDLSHSTSAFIFGNKEIQRGGVTLLAAKFFTEEVDPCHWCEGVEILPSMHSAQRQLDTLTSASLCLISLAFAQSIER